MNEHVTITPEDRSSWAKLREMFDRLFSYDPNPPEVIEEEGYLIIVNDNLPPEANAMTLALYSRDPQSYLVHLVEVLTRGWRSFMKIYYVAYGHRSIGNCGSTTICAESVSMLEAKAIEDSELYNGQEASTRYMDMTKMRVLNPLGTPEGEAILRRWMDFYTEAMPLIVADLKKRFPCEKDGDLKKYEKAIKAKAFDIARAFLPAGCTTFVGWHTTLSHAWDQIYRMISHPLAETRTVAGAMLRAVRKKYESSFNFETRPEQDEYMKRTMDFFAYEHFSMPAGEFFSSTHMFDFTSLTPRHEELLRTRPKGSELHRKFNHLGLLQFIFALDFGSFRDLQRHRSGTQSMPLLTTEWGFHPWYLESMPPSLQMKASQLILEQKHAIRILECSPEVRQYYVAMGFQVVCKLTTGLPSAIYITELRSGQTVHSTLRLVSQKIGRVLQEHFPEISLYCNFDPDEWSTRRGGQDIIRRDS